MLDLSKNINLFQGDCLEVMDKLIEQGVTVDAIIGHDIRMAACLQASILFTD